MKKRITAFFLSVLVVCGLSIPAAAAETGESEVQPLPDSVLYYGTVTSVQTDAEGNITRVVMDSEESGACVMHVQEDTAFVDAGNRSAANPNELIVEGASLYVYHSPLMAYSMPPQTSAFVFVGNLPADAGCPHYHVAEEVTKNDDGSVTVLTDQGSLLLTLQADATVTPYRTKQFLTVDSIEVGTRFMAWYDIVLQSFPGQAGTDAVLVLPEQINDSTAGKIVCGDVALTENYRIENDVKLVPVRAVAEALGLTTSYEEVGNARNVTVESDTFAVHMTEGLDSIYGVTKLEDAVGMTALQSYGAAPYIENPGTTWAPASLFEMLGVTITDADGVLTFQLEE